MHVVWFHVYGGVPNTAVYGRIKRKLSGTHTKPGPAIVVIGGIWLACALGPAVKPSPTTAAAAAKARALVRLCHVRRGAIDAARLATARPN
jgi:hypothetical protein